MLDDDEGSPSPRGRSRAGKLKDKAVALEHEVVKDALKLEHEVVKDAKAGAKAVAKGSRALEKELVKDVKAVEKELVKDGKAVAKAALAGPLPSEEQAAKDEDEREAARLKQRDALQKKAEKQVCPLKFLVAMCASHVDLLPCWRAARTRGEGSHETCQEERRFSKVSELQCNEAM